MFPFLSHTENKLDRSDNHSSIISNYMKKIFNQNLIGILLIALTLLSCDKIPDGIVDVKLVNYKVLEITAPISFSYSSADSTIITSDKIENVETVSSVWCKISSLDGTLTVKNQVLMYDDGNVSLHGDQNKDDKIYSAKFVMGKLNPIGEYQIEYFIEDNINPSPDNLKKIGTHIFNFIPGQINLPPVISNLVIPVSVTRGESFTFTIKADDPNGQLDIAQVYFKLIRPDDTIVTPGQQDDNGSGYFLMHDDGSNNYGDVKAGDGIFSFQNTFGTTSQTGSWKFEFHAKDRSGSLSNVIIHSMTVN